MKKTISFIITFVFLFLVPLRAEEIYLTLDEAIAMALRDNRDILLKAQAVKKAKEKVAESKASLFPSLTFSASWADTRGYYDKNVGQSSTQTTLKQYLYKGGKIINTIKYNGYNFELSQSLLDQAKLEIALNVKKAFYTLMLAMKFSQLNKDILENTTEHFESLRKRYNSGEASESELLQVESSINSVQQEYEASLNQAESSGALLRNLLYLDESVFIKTNDEFKYEPIEIAYTEAFLNAMKMRPEIKQYEAQQKAAQKSVEISKADNRPSVYASWDYYSRSHAASISGVSRNWNDYDIIGVTFSWPIFDGWSTKSKVEQAIIEVKETQILKEKAIKNISLELKNSYLSLRDALSKIRAAESDLRVYKDNLSSVAKKYDQGMASSLDHNDAKIKYDIALFNIKLAIYDYLIAKGNFDKATGG
jgi:outer membrane protein